MKKIRAVCMHFSGVWRFPVRNWQESGRAMIVRGLGCIWQVACGLRGPSASAWMRMDQKSSGCAARAIGRRLARFAGR